MAGSACRTCGTEPRTGARFCDGCGSPIAVIDAMPEHKQVTVLFADVVHSMDLAATLGSERLREVMGELFNRAGSVVQRYGGTVDKFTGDGIMAIFGAPIALEDHAIRACVAALEVQSETTGLAEDVYRRDGVKLQLRVGLNSGDVVVGQLSSSPSSYTAIGAQVGMGQRMESVAPPGGVMISEATARLVEHVAQLDAPAMVTIKNATEPVPARRLRAMSSKGTMAGRREARLVGRGHEMQRLSALLGDVIDGRSAVVGVSGPAGIGKSRMCRELAKEAQRAGVAVYSTFCESHTSTFPFTVVARLLRDRLRIDDVDPRAARQSVREQIVTADPDDLALLEDVVGIRDPAVPSPAVSADARRRRLAALTKAVALEVNAPAVYLVEDVHWIDEASESLLAELISAVPKTQSLLVVTYRPEYSGALIQSPDFHQFTLNPLAGPATASLTSEILGSDPSVAEVTRRIVERSGGNPFYVQEIIREYAERQVLVGDRGTYRRQREVSDISVPPTLQATIGARIDRLSIPAKRTLNAAAVIGTRFDTGLLACVLDNEDGADQAGLAELVHSELIDQVVFTPRAEYGFRHPLVQSVAYQSQLKPARAQLHRRLAAAVQRRDSSDVDDSAALVATHLEAAGDLREAFGWHMRAGAWLTNRDINAARTSWRSAQRLADQLCADEPDRVLMQISPRALLCGSSWRAGGSIADADIDELQALCRTPDTHLPLAMGMAGRLMDHIVHARVVNAAELSTEYVDLVESMAEPTVSVGLLYPAIYTKYIAVHMTEVLRLAQRVIDLAAGDPTKGNFLTGSPLAFATMMRGSARCALGQSGWKDDFNQAIDIAAVDQTTWISMVMFKYVLGIPLGVMVPDSAALNDTQRALETALRCSEDFAVHSAQLARGITLVAAGGADRASGHELLAAARDAALSERFMLAMVPVIDLYTASEKWRAGDLDHAIDISQRAFAEQLDSGALLYLGATANVLVELLTRRDRRGDIEAAQAVVGRLSAMPTERGLVLYSLPLLKMRAQLAAAGGDEIAYRAYVNEYARMATELGFDGHIAAARAMT